MASEGYLTVRVFTSAAQLPIENAIVSLSQASEAGTRHFAIRLTDESGRTERIAVPTPDQAESLQPGQGIPYTAVDVIVEFPEYERVLIEGVQIFPGIVTQQDVELLPLLDLPPAYNLTEIIDIPAQSL